MDAAENQVFTTYNNMGRITRRQTIENNGLGDPNNTLTTDYIYDKFGNMIEQRQIPDPDEPETYLATAFACDALGRRIEFIDSAAAAGWTSGPCASKPPLARGGYLVSKVFYQPETWNLKPETYYYYAHNHLYSPVALMEDDGDVVERYEYDVYGKPYFYNESFTLLDPQKSGHNNPVMFTGQRLDRLDGGDLPLMYYKNRFYYPTSGRFLQRDPRGVQSNLNLFDFIFSGPATLFNDYMISQYKDGMNIYQYVMSDPIGNMDPSGLKSGPCGECAVPSNDCRNFYAEFLGFGKTTGSTGTNPSIINDVKFIQASSSFLSGLQSLMNVASNAACGNPGTKFIDGLLDGTDQLSGDPGSFGELGIKNAMELKNLLARKRGFYLWMKMKFTKCVSCTLWMGTWYAPWRTCKSGKWAYEIVWHPCRLPDPHASGGVDYMVHTTRDFRLALRECYKSIATFPLKPYKDHSYEAERKEYKIEE